MPGLFVNDGGVWKEITTTAPQVKVSGVWTPVSEVHARNGGVWTKVWPTALPPTPTNLRFQFTTWQNGRYEVQPLWDPVQSELADGYHIEVTRVGGANPANAVAVDQGRTNYYYDIYVGTTGGIALTYRVRSYKGASVGDWSAPISATTPPDAGFLHTTFIGLVGDYFGHLYTQIQHDGQAQNAGWAMYRQQMPYYDWTYIKSGPLTGAATNVDDAVGTDHYRGTYAGTVNTGNCFSNDINWAFHLTNTWGKPNDQSSGNPYSAAWSNLPNGSAWALVAPSDRVLRINATSQNVYRQQPTNSLGWVGGVMRCGGNQGDMLGVYFYDKGLLSRWGIRNRISSGQLFNWGLGRRNDGGNLNVTFNPVGLSFSHGFPGDPRSSYEAFAAQTWQRLQGASFQLRQDWSQAFVNPAQPHGSLGVVSGNSAAQYAEFGNIAEIMGGWVNGQLYISSTNG